MDFSFVFNRVWILLTVEMVASIQIWHLIQSIKKKESCPLNIAFCLPPIYEALFSPLSHIIQSLFLLPTLAKAYWNVMNIMDLLWTSKWNHDKKNFFFFFTTNIFYLLLLFQILTIILLLVSIQTLLLIFVGEKEIQDLYS